MYLENVTSPRNLETTACRRHSLRRQRVFPNSCISPTNHYWYQTRWFPLSIPGTLFLKDDDWTFLWWTDDDLEWLLRTHYPQYAASYARMPHTIMKVDTARYFILHLHGGVYADVDIEYTPTKNASLNNVLTRVAPTSMTNLAIIFHECTDNSLMASTRNSTFWLHVFEKWNKAATSSSLPHHKRTVHSVSGVSMLGKVCHEQGNASHLRIVPFESSSKFEVHHGTNSWRWKTKRNDLVLVLDVAILCTSSSWCLSLWCNREKKQVASRRLV